MLARHPLFDLHLPSQDGWQCVLDGETARVCRLETTSELVKRGNPIQCPRWDSNPCWSGFKPPASAIWATGAGYRTAAAILAAAFGQRDASTVGVAEAPPSLIRVSSGRLARSPVAMRSSMTTVVSGRKCTGCTPVIRPVVSSRK
jgi:hypothetical protein